MPAQRALLSPPDGARSPPDTQPALRVPHHPSRLHPLAGFVLLHDTQPEAGPVEYLFQEDKPAAAAAPAAPAEPAVPAAPDAAPAGDEPPPPEPFEYIPS